MKLVPIKPSEAFPLTADQRNSFARAPLPYRVSGTPGLARMVMRGRPKTGAFWFNENVFTRLREQAKTDLAGQGSPGSTNGKPAKDLVGLYIKLCLRNDLAVSKDWTEDFDSYAILPLRPTDTVVAWVGPIKDQPYYSVPDPKRYDKAEYEARLKLHEQAKAGGVGLTATEQQFIIDFNFGENRTQAGRILGPFDF